MLYWWDGCNKWLYLGGGLGQNKRWIVMFGDWFHWFPIRNLTTRSWTLFLVSWDNGAWWGDAIDNALILDDKKHARLDCYIEVTILGVGIRRQYSRKIVFDEEGFKESLKPENLLSHNTKARVTNE